MKNKKIYINFSFFRIFFVFSAVFFAALAFLDFEMLWFCIIMVGFLVLIAFAMWHPGVFVYYKKNLFTIRTMEGLGTLKLPLDEVRSVTGTIVGHGKLSSLEFRIVQTNGYIHRRTLHSIFRDYESVKKRVESLFPKEEPAEIVLVNEYDDYDEYED